MSLEFSFFSYLIIGGFYVVSALGLLLLWWLNRSWKPIKRVVSGLALVLLVLPWADEVWIAWNFQRACEGAGIHVARQVEAEGFVDANSRGRYSTSLTEGPIRKELMDFEKRGFKFSESQLADGKVMHLERKDGWLHLLILDKPKARYFYKYTESYVGIHLKKAEQTVTDNAAGELIGRDTRFKRYPSWIDRLWVGQYGPGVTICKGPIGDTEKSKRKGLIYDYVLKPISTQ